MDINDVKNQLFGDVKKENISSTFKDMGSNSLRIEDIFEFPENPFKKYKDKQIEELSESIKDDGLLSPIILWKQDKSAEKYTILSGHNRFCALKNLGYVELDNKMYKVIEDIPEDYARLIVADANLCQRQKLLPSEKAKAYKIQQEVLENINTKRSEIFAFFSEENTLKAGETAEDKSLCHDVNFDKNRNIYRYLRLNYLIPVILEKVDNQTISLIIGVELSYLKEREQKVVYQYFFEEDNTKINIDICKKIREKSKEIEVTKEVLILITEGLKNSKKSRTFKLKFEEVREISSKDINTEKEAKEYVIKCIKFYEENNL